KVLTRWHPSFAASLEPGVSELVLLLAERYGWITYTSCEGHEYAGSGLDPVERVIGLLPRTDAERAAIVARLGPAVTGLDRDPDAAVRPALVEELLTSKVSGRRYPVVDVRFARGPDASWPAYFAAVGGAYEALLGALIPTSTEAIMRSVSVKGVLVRNGSVLVIEYVDPALHYNFPGGRTREGESLYDALLRTCAQEVQIDVVPDRLLAVAEYDPGKWHRR